MSDKLTKILYVEDDECIAEIATMVLEDIGGFEVKHCFGGAEALENIISYNPQLVLMDVMMPEMDGPETFKRIRALDQPEIKDVPIVFMTAKAQTHEQQLYLAMGALGVIVKPFDAATLCDNIIGLWEKRDS